MVFYAYLRNYHENIHINIHYITRYEGIYKQCDRSYTADTANGIFPLAGKSNFVIGNIFMGYIYIFGYIYIWIYIYMYIIHPPQRAGYCVRLN